VREAFQTLWFWGGQLTYVPFSVRNHGGIPNIDEDAFELEIGGLVNTPVKISMKDLKDPQKFPFALPIPFHSSAY